MGLSPAASRWLPWIPVAACCLLAVWFHAAVEVLPYDDAYITFRYADNLASGRGLHYNPGERVFGSSSPLYTLWLAACKTAAPGVSTPALAVRGNALFHLLTALAAGGLMLAISGRKAVAATVGALVAVHPSLLGISTGGMESVLFTALIAGGCWAAAARRWNAAAALAGLSVLARPEGVLLALVVGAAFLADSVARRSGRRLAGVIVLLALPGAAWAVAASALFGTPVPHSITAKLAPLYPLPPGYAVLTLCRWLGQWTIPAGFGDPAPLRDMAAFGLAALAAAGTLCAGAARQRGAWIVGAVFCGFAAFTAYSNPLFFDWYAAPILVLWASVIAAGVPALAELVGRSGPARARGRSALSVAAALVIAIGAAVPHLRDAAAGRAPVDAIRTPTRLRTIGYSEAGEWLNRHAPPRAVVATPETGALGYAWRGRMLDACGLVSAEAIPFLPVPAAQRENPWTAAISVDFVRATRPDYVVTLEVFARRSLLASSWFAESYEPAHAIRLPRRVWGSDDVLIYARAGMPRGAEER